MSAKSISNHKNNNDYKNSPKLSKVRSYIFFIRLPTSKKGSSSTFSNYLQLIRTMWWFLQSRTILQQIVEFDHARHSFVRQFTYWSKAQINPRIFFFNWNIFSACTSYPAGGSRNTDGAPRCMETRWVMVSAVHSGSKGLGSISRTRFFEGSERTCFHTGKFLVKF